MYLCHWSSSQRKESAMWVSPKAQVFLLFMLPGEMDCLCAFHGCWRSRANSCSHLSMKSVGVLGTAEPLCCHCVCVTEGTAVSTSVFLSGLLLFWNLVSYNAQCTGGLNPRGWRGGYLVKAWNAMPQNWLCGIPDPTLGFSVFLWGSCFGLFCVCPVLVWQ